MDEISKSVPTNLVYSHSSEVWWDRPTYVPPFPTIIAFSDDKSISIISNEIFQIFQNVDQHFEIEIAPFFRTAHVYDILTSASWDEYVHRTLLAQHCIATQIPQIHIPTFSKIAKFEISPINLSWISNITFPHQQNLKPVNPYLRNRPIQRPNTFQNLHSSIFLIR